MLSGPQPQKSQVKGRGSLGCPSHPCHIPHTWRVGVLNLFLSSCFWELHLFFPHSLRVRRKQLWMGKYCRATWARLSPLLLKGTKICPELKGQGPPGILVVNHAGCSLSRSYKLTSSLLQALWWRGNPWSGDKSACAVSHWRKPGYCKRTGNSDVLENIVLIEVNAT